MNWMTSYLVMEYKLDKIKTITYIEYSKISEILADTGAIISWILQISVIVLEYNKRICTDKTINEVIKMYFPDFLNLNIKRNYSGQIISAQFKDKHYEPVKIDKLMRRVTNMINPKICFMNLQYEVSRLQFLLTKQLDITCINNCVNTENKIENFLDQFDYRIKLNQPESIINISQGQTVKNVQAEIQDPENLEIQYLESTLGLFYFQPELQQIMKEKEENTEKEIDLSIIPKECLKQEDLSGLNSPH